MQQRFSSIRERNVTILLPRTKLQTETETEAPEGDKLEDYEDRDAEQLQLELVAQLWRERMSRDGIERFETKAAKQLRLLRASKMYPYVLLRVRLPGGVHLQARFNSEESLEVRPSLFCRTFFWLVTQFACQFCSTIAGSLADLSTFTSSGVQPRRLHLFLFLQYHRSPSTRLLGTTAFQPFSLRPFGERLCDNAILKCHAHPVAGRLPGSRSKPRSRGRCCGLRSRGLSKLRALFGPANPCAVPR